MPPVLWASISKSEPVTTNQLAWLYYNLTHQHIFCSWFKKVFTHLNEHHPICVACVEPEVNIWLKLDFRVNSYSLETQRAPEFRQSTYIKVPPEINLCRLKIPGHLPNMQLAFRCLYSTNMISIVYTSLCCRHQRQTKLSRNARIYR
jgi:hypothetical protein